jgi:excinuclease ABC subunit C
MPDLILLDGGQGHVNMAAKIAQELGLIVPIVGVAKGSSRKKLELQFADTGKITKEIQKVLDNKLLVKRIMDEAHRFAITFHRKLRRKNALI